MKSPISGLTKESRPLPAKTAYWYAIQDGFASEATAQDELVCGYCRNIISVGNSCIRDIDFDAPLCSAECWQQLWDEYVWEMTHLDLILKEPYAKL